jgi:hypothetical protein
MRPKPRGLLSTKADTHFFGGLRRGRQIHSPAPECMSSPSEVVQLPGRKSSVRRRSFSPSKNMEVSGARPTP